jgi:hypothetical protein
LYLYDTCRGRLRRKKSEAKVSGKREEKREQIVQPGAAVAAVDIREGVRSEEERKEDRRRKGEEIKAISRKEGGDSMQMQVGMGDGAQWKRA